LKFLSFEDLGDVKVKEVAVQNGLYTASHYCDDIIEVFCVVAVDPVDNVESSVRSKSKQIMRRDWFGFPGFGYHK